MRSLPVPALLLAATGFCGFLGTPVARGQCSYCGFCPFPFVKASQDVICPGQSVELTVFGSPPCFWAPSDGLTNTTSCTNVARPSRSTTYTVSTIDSFRHCRVDASVTIGVLPAPSLPAIQGPASALPGQAGLTASVDFHWGSSYAWTIFNGTITSGQGTNAITFSAGPGPVKVDGMQVGVVLSVVESSTAGCQSEAATATVTLSSSRKPRSVPFR